MTTITYTDKELREQKKLLQPAWQRIVLLVILGYESAGCLLGGSFLIAQPDGHLMDMPVDILHGSFIDFHIPGIILYGLGILNTLAFIAVLRRSGFDWFMAGMALGGLFIWFWVEIAILREIVWLHAMWGLPVLMGWVVLIPLIVSRHDTTVMRRILLTCGMLSSLWYLVINISVPMQYPGYSAITLTVSELSATGAPTRILWVLLAMLYPMLLMAFGWGVLKAVEGNRHLRTMGILLIIYAVVNFYWPPMHQRQFIGAGGGTLSDTLHIVWAMIALLFMMLVMGFGAAGLGKAFRFYTIVTFVVFIVFGILIGVETPGISANLPTPHIGVWERINIGAFMVWVIVLSIVLMKKNKMRVQTLNGIASFYKQSSI